MAFLATNGERITKTGSAITAAPLCRFEDVSQLLSRYCQLEEGGQEVAGFEIILLGFIGTLNVVRRGVQKFQRVELEKIPFFTWLVREILSEQIPPKEGRSNPRVVKITRAKFPSNKPIHKGTRHTLPQTCAGSTKLNRTVAL